MGRAIPSTSDGVTSCAASLPRNETPRSLSHGATDACRPAALRAMGHGPSFSRRAQRPVRTNSASPADTLRPACFSHASRSSTKIGVPGSRYGTFFNRAMSMRTPRVTTPFLSDWMPIRVQPFSVLISARE